MVKPHLPSPSDVASLDAVLFVREELNNINYKRRERERDRRRYTWFTHWPLRCPPVSNAIINYLAVGATTLAPLGLFLVLLHPRDLFLPLSFLTRISLLLYLLSCGSQANVSATKPSLFVYQSFDPG